MASHSFGHQRSWGTFSYTVFWCILFDWATLSMPVYWVDTSFFCQEHSFSDKAQKQTSLDAKSHEAWIWGFTMDLPFCTSVREICHVGNIWKRRHSGTWHWELRAEQRDSKIEEGSTPISVFWYLNIFNNVLYDSHDRCLENPNLRYLHGLSASWYRSSHCNDTTHFNWILHQQNHPSNLSYFPSTAFLCLCVAAA